MKRFFFVFLFALFSVFGAFSHVGVGGGGDFFASPHESSSAISVSFRTDTSPWGVTLSALFESDFSEFKHEFSIFVDNWFVYERLSSFVDFFVLWGISAEFFAKTQDDFFVGSGARLGTGLSFMFFDRKIELLTQAVWNPYVALGKDSGDFSVTLRPLFFPLSLALRFWI